MNWVELTRKAAGGWTVISQVVNYRDSHPTKMQAIAGVDQEFDENRAMDRSLSEDQLFPPPASFNMSDIGKVYGNPDLFQALTSWQLAYLLPASSKKNDISRERKTSGSDLFTDSLKCHELASVNIGPRDSSGFLEIPENLSAFGQ
jgi:hypothetical protein